MWEIKHRAKRCDNNEWVYGNYACLGYDTEYERHVICVSTLATWVTANFYLTYIDVDKTTIGMFTGKTDVEGVELYEGDVIELLDGSKAVIEFGTFDGYCPVDKCWMDSVGFYARCLTKERPALPIGPTEDYAEKICTIDEWSDEE